MSILTTENTLPAGTICKRGGVPFELVADTVIRCHPDNWPDIRDGFVPSVSYGPTCVDSQALQPPPVPDWRV